MDPRDTQNSDPDKVVTPVPPQVIDPSRPPVIASHTDNDAAPRNGKVTK